MKHVPCDDCSSFDFSCTRACEQPGFIYFECPECEFNSVQPVGFNVPKNCPLCAGDSGHYVVMDTRTARKHDKPEGHDARVPPKPELQNPVTRSE